MKIKLCKLGLHEYISQRAYEVHGIGVSGEVKVCLNCGKLKKWGNIIIPKHFQKIRREKWQK